MGWVSKVKKNPKVITELAKDYIEANPKITEAYYHTFLKSFLLGQMAAHRGGKLEMADDGLTDKFISHPMSYTSAIEFAENRVTLSPEDFAKISDELKAKAWTVGRLTQLDAVERVKQHYIKNLKTEISEKAFIEAVLKDIDIVTASQGLSRPYLSMVYRTNTMSDFNAGKLYEWSQDPPMALEFLGIDDKRQTSLCAARSGVIRSYTNPWWDTNTPPLHYRCRSTVRAIYEDEYNELMGAGKISKKDIQKAPKIEKITSGFGHKPFVENSHFWKYTPAQQMRVAKYMIQDELNGVVGNTICKDFEREIPGMVNVKTNKGGVRYAGTQKDAVKGELKDNIPVAEHLANEYGYYVELPKIKNIPGNTEFDAWVNGVEKWEFKYIGTTNLDTLSTNLRGSRNQAPNIFIKIKGDFDIGNLSKALTDRLHGDGMVIIQNGGKSYKIPRKNLRSESFIFDLLTRKIL